VLSDGETIGIGSSLFVFKSASAGNLSRDSDSHASAADTGAGRRLAR
jgi:hypothetical protein